MQRTIGIGLTAAALLAAGAGSAAAASTHAKTGVQHFSETEAGTQLSTAGLRFEDVFKIKRSPFGEGTVIRDFTLTGTKFPASGKDTATSFYRDGRLTANETVTLGTPSTDGIGIITGTGTCASGTFKHQGETCTYKITGNYDLVTGRTFLTLSGTYTPSTAATSKK